MWKAGIRGLATGLRGQQGQYSPFFVYEISRGYNAHPRRGLVLGGVFISSSGISEAAAAAVVVVVVVVVVAETLQAITQGYWDIPSRFLPRG